MNRRQTRHMEKKMGITKYKKSLPYKERMARLTTAVKKGSEKQKQMVDTVRRQNQSNQDKEESAKIASMATTLVVTEGLSYIEALIKAQEMYRNNKNS